MSLSLAWLTEWQFPRISSRNRNIYKIAYDFCQGNICKFGSMKKESTFSWDCQQSRETFNNLVRLSTISWDCQQSRETVNFLVRLSTISWDCQQSRETFNILVRLSTISWDCPLYLFVVVLKIKPFCLCIPLAVWLLWLKTGLCPILEECT